VTRRSVGLLGFGADRELGGIPTHTRLLEHDLIRSGWSVHSLGLATAPGRPVFGVRKEARGRGAHWSYAYRYQDHATWRDLVEHPLAASVVRAWLAEVRPTVVHVHHLTGFGLGALHAVADRRVPLVMTLHDYWTICPRGQLFAFDGRVCEVPEPRRCAACIGDTWPHLDPLSPSAVGGDPIDPIDAADAAQGLGASARAALERVDRLVVPSAAAAARFERAGLDRRRMTVVENGLDVDGLRDAVRERRARLGPHTPRTGLRLGVLGAVQPSKGVLMLARAFQAADLDGAPPVELRIHGPLASYHGDPSEVDALRRLAERDPRIRLAGPFERAELPSVLAELDAVAAPALWPEVHGLGVREARVAGLGVLVADRGDLPAAAQEGRAGLVVRAEPGSELAAWRRALEHWARDARGRARWSAAPLRVRRADDAAAELETLYLEIAGAFP